MYRMFALCTDEGLNPSALVSLGIGYFSLKVFGAKFVSLEKGWTKKARCFQASKVELELNVDSSISKSNCFCSSCSVDCLIYTCINLQV